MNRRKTVTKVLELKSLTKEQLEIEGIKTRDELNTEKARHELLEETLQNSVAEFSERQKDGLIDIQEVDLFYNYIIHLSRKIEKQKDVVLQKAAELEDKQKAVLEAYKEKKLFEIMNGKLLFESAKELITEEQKEMDYNFISKRMR
jgi:flagellar export protein FliJ